jgi:hypothetical protein
MFDLHLIPSPVNLQDLRKGLGDLRDGLKRIRQELGDHFADMDQNEKYGKQMWNFVGKANVQLEDLIDNVNLADTTFTEAIKYFGEEDKTMSSSEFYAIFKTFVTSYKVFRSCYLYGPQLMSTPSEMQDGEPDPCRRATSTREAATAGG